MTDLKEGIELRKRSSQAISVRVGFLGLSVGNLYGIVHALQFVSIGVGSSGNGTSSDSLSISCGMNEMKNEETKCEAADLLYVQKKKGENGKTTAILSSWSAENGFRCLGGRALRLRPPKSSLSFFWKLEYASLFLTFSYFTCFLFSRKKEISKDTYNLLCFELVYS